MFSGGQHPWNAQKHKQTRVVGARLLRQNEVFRECCAHLKSVVTVLGTTDVGSQTAADEDWHCISALISSDNMATINSYG